MTGTIVSLLKKEFPASLQGIYLFGSQAQGTATDRSDVDIAVLLSPEKSTEITSLEIFDVRMNLEQELGREVDLVNLRRVSTVFQKEIIFGGNRIYCSDETTADTFEMLTISYYCKLNEERREILEAFRRDKRAYNI